MGHLSAWLIGLELVARLASAQTDGQYLERLHVMQAHVRGRLATSSLFDEAPVPEPVIGRFLAGQSWSVEATPAPDAIVRKSGAREDLLPAARAPQRFDFKVVEVDRSGNATIDVRKPGGADHLVIVLSPRHVLLEKELHRRGRATALVRLGAGGNVALGFDEYPIDLPDLTANRGKPTATPGVREFLFDDLYGRPVRVLWREGAVWPELVRTPAQTAVLVHEKEASS